MSRTFHKALAPRLAAAASALVVAVVATLALASPARAHDELLGTDPAADSTVDELPPELTLTFSGIIASESGASEVEVTDAAGTALTDGEPTAQDNMLIQPLSGAASGEITVLWKVVSSDGHPISGEFSFTVAGGAAPDETGTPAPTATGEPDETSDSDVTSDSDETAAPTQTTAPTVPADDAGATSGETWPWILLGVVALAVVAAVVYLLTSRRRRESPAAGAPADADRPGSEPPADR